MAAHPPPRTKRVYHVIEVSPARFPRVNAAGARAFADLLVSPRVQALVGAFGVEKVGDPLFVPDAGKPELPDA